MNFSDHDNGVRANTNDSGSNSSGTDERRQQILEAAVRALAAEGFEKITTRRIAREAGVNVATLHYHFGTKEALLAAAVRHSLGRAEAMLRPVMNEAPDAATALAAGLDTLWNFVRERRGVLRYDLMLRALRDTGARCEAAGVYATYRRLVEQIVERHRQSGSGDEAAGPPLAAGTPAASAIAHYVVAAVDGILLQHLITGDEAAARGSLEMVRAHALSLLGPAASDNGQQDRGQQPEQNV
jgi:AcrR family transcriptional regulator